MMKKFKNYFIEKRFYRKTILKEKNSFLGRKIRMNKVAWWFKSMIASLTAPS